MKANVEKSHLLLNGGAMVEWSSTEKLLGIQIDSDLTFDKHISYICNKVGRKSMYSAALLIIRHLISAVW